jgi:hypothetical protein
VGTLGANLAACRLLILIAKITRQKLSRAPEPTLGPLQTSLDGTRIRGSLFGERNARARARYVRGQKLKSEMIKVHGQSERAGEIPAILSDRAEKSQFIELSSALIPSALLHPLGEGRARKNFHAPGRDEISLLPVRQCPISSIRQRDVHRRDRSFLINDRFISARNVYHFYHSRYMFHACVSVFTIIIIGQLSFVR